MAKLASSLSPRKPASFTPNSVGQSRPPITSVGNAGADTSPTFLQRLGQWFGPPGGKLPTHTPHKPVEYAFAQPSQLMPPFQRTAPAQAPTLPVPQAAPTQPMPDFSLAGGNLATDMPSLASPMPAPSGRMQDYGPGGSRDPFQAPDPMSRGGQAMAEAMYGSQQMGRGQFSSAALDYAGRPLPSPDLQDNPQAAYARGQQLGEEAAQLRQAQLPSMSPEQLRESYGGRGTSLTPQAGEGSMLARQMPLPHTLGVGVPQGMSQAMDAQRTDRLDRELGNAALAGRMDALTPNTVNQSFSGNIGEYSAAMRAWREGQGPHPGTFGMVSSPGMEGQPAGTVPEMRRMAEQNRTNAVNARLGTTPQERATAAAEQRENDLAVRQMLVENRAAQRGAVRGQRLGIPRQAPPTMTPEVAQAIRAEDGGGLSDAQRRLVDTYRYGGPEAARMDTQRFAGQQAQLDRQAERDIARLNADAQSGARRSQDQADLTEATANLANATTPAERTLWESEVQRLRGALGPAATAGEQQPTQVDAPLPVPTTVQIGPPQPYGLPIPEQTHADEGPAWRPQTPASSPDITSGMNWDRARSALAETGISEATGDFGELSGMDAWMALYNSDPREFARRLEERQRGISDTHHYRRRARQAGHGIGSGIGAPAGFGSIPYR